MTKWIFIALGLTFAASCTQANSGQLKKIEAKQDSILVLLKDLKPKIDFIASYVGYQPENPDPVNIPLDGSYSTGPAKPTLTLVEFSDFQCPYCAQLAPTIDSIAKVFPNEVRVVFKHFPLSFHEQARGAHAAALAAGKQGKFWEYRYTLAPKFRSLSDSTYLDLAKQLGLNLDQFKKDMALTPDDQEIMNRDMELGQKVGVRGTPTLFANGVIVRDRSFEGLVKLLEDARAK